MECPLDYKLAGPTVHLFQYFYLQWRKVPCPNHHHIPRWANRSTHTHSVLFVSLTSAYKFPMHTGIPATHTAPIESLCDGQCDQISQSSQLSFGNSTSSMTQPLDVSKVRELLPELFPLCSRCTFSFWTYISCPLQLNQLSEIHKIGPTTLFGPKPL